LAIECVLIPRANLEDSGLEEEEDYEDADAEESLSAESRAERPVTLCISTQVGCAMGCVFCASGQAGLKRGLGAQEVVSQFILARRHLDEGERIKNIVFMGMGEPLHHYAETARAIRLLTHPLGIGLSPRRITVSTVGLISGIQKLGEDFAGKIGLAISLHAPDGPTRSRIVPMNDSQPLAELIEALRRYPLPKRRRITIEYTLIDGVNDQVGHARQARADVARATREGEPDPDEPDPGLRAARAQAGSGGGLPARARAAAA
jgi:23S rRNA (adenine2503-C2)-methyltransferase